MCETGIEQLLAVADATCYQDNGNLTGAGPLEDAIRNLSHQRLAVGGSFAGDDHRCIRQQTVEPYRIEQEINARSAFGIHVLQECIPESACSPGARHMLAIVAEVAGGDFGEPLGAGIEQWNHFLRGALLRGKHVSCSVLAAQGIGDIGSNREAHGVEFANIIPRAVLRKAVDDGADHADAAVARRTAAKSDDDVLAPAAHGIRHKLTGAVAGRHQGIALLRGEECQSAGLSRLDHGCIAQHPIWCRDTSHERIPHIHLHNDSLPTGVGRGGAPKSLQPSFAAVADGNLYHLCLGHPRKNTRCRCLISLCGRQATLE